MPVEYTGFTLKPVGFFDRNPAIDLAPAEDGHCHSSSRPLRAQRKPREDITPSGNLRWAACALNGASLRRDPAWT
jgi:hypothetical protein